MLRTIYVYCMFLASSLTYGGDSPAIDFLIGSWEVSEIHHCPHICAMEDEEANSYVGKVVTYAKYSATNGEASCKEVSYSFRHVSNDDWFYVNKYYPEDIGLPVREVVTIELSCGGMFGKPWFDFGGGVAIKDQNTIILSRDGIDFEVIRQ